MVDASFEAPGPFDRNVPSTPSASRVPSTLATGGRATFSSSSGYAYVPQFQNSNFAIGIQPFSLRFQIKPVNPATGASQAPMSLWQQGNQAASQWLPYLTGAGALAIAWMDAAPNLISATSTANPVFPTNNTPLWCRINVVPTSGAVTFYTSSDGLNWNQLGAVVTAADVSGKGVQSIAGINTTFVLGQGYAGAVPFAGDLYQAQLWIGGVLVANPVATPQGFRDSGGFGWTASSSGISFGTTLLGSTVKLRGTILYNPDWPFWAEFWSKWDWKGYIKPCLDASAALGANVVELNAPGIADNGVSYPSDAVFQARLHQFFTYAASLGMGVYLQLGYQPAVQFLADGSGVAAGVALSAKVAGWAEQEPNLLAIDVMNEWDIAQPSTWTAANTGAAQAITDLTTLINGVRAVTTRPLTISALNPVNWSQVAALVDFHDVHYYYNNGGASTTFGPTVFNAMRLSASYRGAFILGETGIPGAIKSASGYSPAIQQAWMSAVPQVVDLPDCVGACHWTLVDTYGNGLTVGDWGMCSPGLPLNPRSQLAAGFQTWPGHF